MSSGRRGLPGPLRSLMGLRIRGAVVSHMICYHPRLYFDTSNGVYV